MTTNNKGKAARDAFCIFFAVLVLTIFSGLDAAAAGARAEENSTSKPKRTAETNTKKENTSELKCRVSGNTLKVITMTNASTEVITAGTKINFTRDTGVSKQAALRSDLQPGQTSIVYIGGFTGVSCRCDLVRK